MECRISKQCSMLDVGCSLGIQGVVTSSRVEGACACACAARSSGFEKGSDAEDGGGVAHVVSGATPHNMFHTAKPVPDG